MSIVKRHTFDGASPVSARARLSGARPTDTMKSGMLTMNQRKMAMNRVSEPLEPTLLHPPIKELDQIKTARAALKKAKTELSYKNKKLFSQYMKMAKQMEKEERSRRQSLEKDLKNIQTTQKQYLERDQKRKRQTMKTNASKNIDAFRGMIEELDHESKELEQRLEAEASTRRASLEQEALKTKLFEFDKVLKRKLALEVSVYEELHAIQMAELKRFNSNELAEMELRHATELGKDLRAQAGSEQCDGNPTVTSELETRQMEEAALLQGIHDERLHKLKEHHNNMLGRLFTVYHAELAVLREANSPHNYRTHSAMPVGLEPSVPEVEEGSVTQGQSRGPGPVASIGRSAAVPMVPPPPPPPPQPSGPQTVAADRPKLKPGTMKATRTAEEENSSYLAHRRQRTLPMGSGLSHNGRAGREDTSDAHPSSEEKDGGNGTPRPTLITAVALAASLSSSSTASGRTSVDGLHEDPAQRLQSPLKPPPFRRMPSSPGHVPNRLRTGSAADLMAPTGTAMQRSRTISASTRADRAKAEAAAGKARADRVVAERARAQAAAEQAEAERMRVQAAAEQAEAERVLAEAQAEKAKAAAVMQQRAKAMAAAEKAMAEVAMVEKAQAEAEAQEARADRELAEAEAEKARAVRAMAEKAREEAMVSKAKAERAREDARAAKAKAVAEAEKARADLAKQQAMNSRPKPPPTEGLSYHPPPRPGSMPKAAPSAPPPSSGEDEDTMGGFLASAKVTDPTDTVAPKPGTYAAPESAGRAEKETVDMPKRVQGHKVLPPHPSFYMQHPPPKSAAVV